MLRREAVVDGKHAGFGGQSDIARQREMRVDGAGVIAPAVKVKDGPLCLKPVRDDPGPRDSAGIRAGDVHFAERLEGLCKGFQICPFFGDIQLVTERREKSLCLK